MKVEFCQHLRSLPIKSKQLLTTVCCKFGRRLFSGNARSAFQAKTKLSLQFQVNPNSKAYRQGIEEGDRLISFDGKVSIQVLSFQTNYSVVFQTEEKKLHFISKLAVLSTHTQKVEQFSSLHEIRQILFDPPRNGIRLTLERTACLYQCKSTVTANEAEHLTEHQQTTTTTTLTTTFDGASSPADASKVTESLSEKPVNNPVSSVIKPARKLQLKKALLQQAALEKKKIEEETKTITAATPPPANTFES